ncbi:hypothetical protein GUJ93_ZPchr0003g18600 [Zizania palustris]|uniref:Uncharacterized protein n=1 Tax=Zizania palustris TaxID=103762 RepID=A0A8J5SJB6_ZIZPA|nr:hypothetical protein GUJ93_ZPchr0003g18600 [Zizania palustris]
MPAKRRSRAEIARGESFPIQRRHLEWPQDPTFTAKSSTKNRPKSKCGRSGAIDTAARLLHDGEFFQRNQERGCGNTPLRFASKPAAKQQSSKLSPVFLQMKPQAPPLTPKQPQDSKNSKAKWKLHPDKLSSQNNQATIRGWRRGRKMWTTLYSERSKHCAPLYLYASRSNERRSNQA